MKKTKIYLLLLISLIAGITGCKKWLDINKDPANVQVPTAQVLLSPILYQMANNVAIDSRGFNKYVQYWHSQSENDTWDTYGYTAASDFGGSLWRMVYVNFGPNLEDMIKDGEITGNYIYAGIGYAIKAWGFQMLTDYHGPVILDEAFTPNKLTFHYQDQPEVYQKVREWAHLAIDNLNKIDAIDQSAFLQGASGDQIFKGDRLKWKKFVYGLLAIQFNHLINKPEYKTAYADSVIRYADLSFSSTSEDATVFFNASNADDSNPFGPKRNLITATAYGRISQTLVDLLSGGMRNDTARVDTLKDARIGKTTSDDPRLFRMMISNPDSTYKGVVASLGDISRTKTRPHIWGEITGTYPGRYLFADNARFPIMTYSQMQFIKAEAQFIKGDLTGAHTSYLNAIKAHMEFVNNYRSFGTELLPPITQAEIDNYMNSNSVAQTPDDLKISDIMGQKFIALFAWGGLETWADLRKYHYDTTVYKTYRYPEPNRIYIQNKGKIVYRVRPRYNSEYVWNRSELEKWGGTQDDYHTTELWFSQP